MTAVDLTPIGAGEPPAAADPLAPVRRSLLADARRDAAADLDAARADAAAVTDRAQREADAILAAAAERGTADGVIMARADLMQTRRQAREVVLAAQRDAFDQLRHEGRAAVNGFCTSQEGIRTYQRLERVAHARAGATGQIVDHPNGGFVVQTSSWRLDLSLTTLADRALDALGRDVEGLWTP